MTLIQFCTSASPLINVVTSEKSWFVAGSIGQCVSTVYGRTVDKDTERKQIKCTWLFILVN
jgi:hypothetical protein